MVVLEYFLNMGNRYKNLLLLFLLLIPDFVFANNMPGLGDYFEVSLFFAAIFGCIVAFSGIFIEKIISRKQIESNNLICTFLKLFSIPIIVDLFLFFSLQNSMYYYDSLYNFNSVYDQHCKIGNSIQELIVLNPIIWLLLATIFVFVKFLKHRNLDNYKISYFITWLKVFSIGNIAILILLFIVFTTNCKTLT